MRNAISRTSKTHARSGLSLVELMISLAISSMLLVAVAAAYSASSNMIQINDRFFRATQAARVSMNQILTDIRRCDWVEVDANGIHVRRTDELRLDDEFVRTYAWKAGDADNPPRLVLSIRDLEDEITGPYTLASNVTSAVFEADTRPVADGPPVIVRVTVTLIVEVDGMDLRLSGSAVPRRAMIY